MQVKQRYLVQGTDNALVCYFGKVCFFFILVGEAPQRQYSVDTRENPLALHTIIVTKEAPHAPKSFEGRSLNVTHKSWQTARDFLQTWAPTYSDPMKGWILSLMDGVGGVSKAVAHMTLHGQPYNCIAVESDPVQWKACAAGIQEYIERQTKTVWIPNFLM